MPIYRVKLFAYLKDKFGPVIEVESAARSNAVIQALADKGLPMTSARFAVNQEFVLTDRDVRESDEMAVIPPVSGG